MRIPTTYREEGTPAFEPKFLPEKQYADALETFVLVCTDCVFIDRKNKKFYLMKRRAKPMAYWWLIGGRSFAGEEPLAAVRRRVERETELDIAPERFVFYGLHRYFFKDRQQEPQDKGCDSITYNFGVNITAAEVAAVRLDPKEYEVGFGLKAFGRRDLVNASVFPALVDLYDTVFPRSRFFRAVSNFCREIFCWR